MCFCDCIQSTDHSVALLIQIGLRFSPAGLGQAWIARSPADCPHTLTLLARSACNANNHAPFQIRPCSCGTANARKGPASVVAQVKEECGYEVSPDKLQWVTQYVSAVGTSGSRSDMFYVEVDESMRVNQGGGLE